MVRPRQDELVRLQQARQHRWYLLGTVGCPGYLGQLGHVARVAHRDPAQRLYPFGELVDEPELLARVLVEQQMQLVEGGATDQPVVLLVERVEQLCVGEDAVERLA